MPLEMSTQEANGTISPSESLMTIPDKVTFCAFDNKQVIVKQHKRVVFMLFMLYDIDVETILIKVNQFLYGFVGKGVDFFNGVFDKNFTIAATIYRP